MSEILISTTSLFLDPLAGLILLYAILVDPKVRKASIGVRLGLALCAAGLGAQGIRSYIAFTTGEFPSEFLIPWWIFKDWGLVMLAFSYLIARLSKRQI